jgi:uncharacterized integral membrane protein
MQFLKTLFWVALAVILVLFAHANWQPATLNLWGGLQADVKLPVLILASFLLGFLPMLIVHRARMWTTKRGWTRSNAGDRARHRSPLPRRPPRRAASRCRPRPSFAPEAERIATDTKVWPGP